MELIDKERFVKMIIRKRSYHEIQLKHQKVPLNMVRMNEKDIEVYKNEAELPTWQKNEHDVMVHYNDSKTMREMKNRWYSIEEAVDFINNISGHETNISSFRKYTKKIDTGIFLPGIGIPKSKKDSDHTGRGQPKILFNFAMILAYIDEGQRYIGKIEELNDKNSIVNLFHNANWKEEFQNKVLECIKNNDKFKEAKNNYYLDDKIPYKIAEVVGDFVEKEIGIPHNELIAINKALNHRVQLLQEKVNHHQYIKDSIRDEYNTLDKIKSDLNQRVTDIYVNSALDIANINKKLDRILQYTEFSSNEK